MMICTSRSHYYAFTARRHHQQAAMLLHFNVLGMTTMATGSHSGVLEVCIMLMRPVSMHQALQDQLKGGCRATERLQMMIRVLGSRFD